VNERDALGDDIVPDYMTRVLENSFYGWPWTYWNITDTRVDIPKPETKFTTRLPDYALGSHTASLGLKFYDLHHTQFPEKYRGGAFVGQHGSWNRRELSGYKVVFIPFNKDGMPDGKPEDFLTGFISDTLNAQVYGRPVGVQVTKYGSLLVADDTGGVVWSVTYTGK